MPCIDEQRTRWIDAFQLGSGMFQACFGSVSDMLQTLHFGPKSSIVVVVEVVVVVHSSKELALSLSPACADVVFSHL